MLEQEQLMKAQQHQQVKTCCLTLGKLALTTRKYTPHWQGGKRYDEQNSYTFKLNKHNDLTPAHPLQDFFSTPAGKFELLKS